MRVMSATKSLQICKQTELWVLLGSHWKLPLLVFWHDSVVAEVRVGAGVSLLRKQREVGQFKLEQMCFRREFDNFFIYRHTLEATALSSTTVDPEDLVEWTPLREQAPVGDFVPPDDFITGYCQSPYATIRDPLLADLAWVSFCKWMLHWLMFEQRTVSLIFAELVPLQVRRNWAQVLAKLEQKELPRNRRYVPNMEKILGRGVPKLAISDYLIGWAGKYCEWNLEIRTTSDWDHVVEKFEMERWGKYDGTHWHMVRQQMIRQLPELLLCYEQYLQKASQPSVQLRKMVKVGRYGNMAALASGKKITPFSPFLDRNDLRAAPDSEGGSEDLVSEDEILRSLPALQQNAKDLRNGYFNDCSGI